jgi:hypothetical protein
MRGRFRRRPADPPTPVERSRRPSALPRPGWSCFPGRSAGLKATNKEKKNWERILKRIQIDKRKSGHKLTHLRPASSPPRGPYAPLQPLAAGLLLLEGLAQIFVRNTELDQFLVELRGLILPLLEGRLRPLERVGSCWSRPSASSRAKRSRSSAAWASARAACSCWSWVSACWRAACS